MLDVQMSSTSMAIKIRIEYTRKKNEDRRNFGSLRLVNCVVVGGWRWKGGGKWTRVGRGGASGGGGGAAGGRGRGGRGRGG